MTDISYDEYGWARAKKEGDPAPQMLPPPAARSVFVLDTENTRILMLDETGRVTATFDSTSDERLGLRGPMAIASDGRSLFVANSLAAQVVVLDLSGHLQKILSLEPVSEGAVTPRPIGL